MKRTMFVGLILLLVGCTTWYKPGATQQSFDRDKAACIAASYQQFPVATVPVQTATGYTTPVRTNCQTQGNQTDCTSTGGGYQSPMTAYRDQNIQARDAAFASCMYERGYSTQPQAQQNQAAPTQLKTVIDELLKENAAACERDGYKPL